MLLYSVVDRDLLIEEFETADEPSWTHVEYEGKQLVIENLDVQQARILRLISTDPADYLRPELSPGTILNLSY